MDSELLKKLEEQEKKIDAIFTSVERTRKYFLWTLIMSIVIVIIPLIVILFMLPALLHNIAFPMGW